MDSRIMPSPIPTNARASGPIRRWVVVAGWVTSDYTIENGVYRFRTDKEEIHELSGIEFERWNVFELTRQGDMLVGTANSSSLEIKGTIGPDGSTTWELIDHGPISIPTAATLLRSADEEG